jgi:hypothetical protein
MNIRPPGFLRVRSRRIFASLALLIFAFTPSALRGGNHDRNLLVVPSGRRVVIDGVLAPGEWDSARSLELAVRSGWKVRVWFQHDGRKIYFAFRGLEQGREMRFPELLFDSHTTRTAGWTPGDFWLHSSFNLCEGEGEYNVYERAGAFQCSKDKSGWSANHFPLHAGGVMEIEVSFRKLGIEPTRGTRVGFAFDLTDTQKNWTFWPEKAQLEHPATWGTIVLD